jgi:hypothetical protein
MVPLRRERERERGVGERERDGREIVTTYNTLV